MSDEEKKFYNLQTWVTEFKGWKRCWLYKLPSSKISST